MVRALKNLRDQYVKPGCPDFTDIGKHLDAARGIVGAFTKDQCGAINNYLDAKCLYHEDTIEYSSYNGRITSKRGFFGEVTAVFSYGDLDEWCRVSGYVIVPLCWVSGTSSGNNAFSVSRKSSLVIRTVRSEANHPSLNAWPGVKNSWPDDFKMFLATIVGAGEAVLDSMRGIIGQSSTNDSEAVYLYKIDGKVVAMSRQKNNVLPVEVEKPTIEPSAITADERIFIDLANAEGSFTLKAAQEVSGFGEKKARSVLSGLVDANLLIRDDVTGVGKPIIYRCGSMARKEGVM